MAESVPKEWTTFSATVRLALKGWLAKLTLTIVLMQTVLNILNASMVLMTTPANVNKDTPVIKYYFFKYFVLLNQNLNSKSIVISWDLGHRLQGFPSLFCCILLYTWINCCFLTTIYSRDVESKNFSFDSQLPVPKIGRSWTSNSQRQRPKNLRTPNSHFHILIFRSTPNSQFTKL